MSKGLEAEEPQVHVCTCRCMCAPVCGGEQPSWGRAGKRKEEASIPVHRTTSYQARKAKLRSLALQMRELRFGEAQQPDKYTTKSCTYWTLWNTKHCICRFAHTFPTNIPQGGEPISDAWVTLCNWSHSWDMAEVRSESSSVRLGCSALSHPH